LKEAHTIAALSRHINKEIEVLQEEQQVCGEAVV
jgi:hypothetical protein